MATKPRYRILWDRFMLSPHFWEVGTAKFGYLDRTKCYLYRMSANIEPLKRRIL